MGEKKRDKEYTRVKNIHLVENNHIYSFEELQELLEYKTINPIIYFVEKKNLQTIDNNHIWGRKLREFDKELKANKPKALDNQLWCPSCQSPKDVENNEITIKIDYNVRYKSGHNKLQIYTAIFTGMRQGELLGLEWKNIDFENKKLYVRQQFNGKTLTPKLKTATSRRTIDLTDGVVECLLEYKRVLPELHDLVFCTKLGTPLLSANIRERWYYPLLRSFKWEGYEFHSLRHTYASLMLSQGVPYLYVSKQMGHAKPTVTLNVYGHFIPDENENAVAKLEDMYRNYLNGINNKLLKRNCGEHGIKISFSEIQA